MWVEYYKWKRSDYGGKNQENREKERRMWEAKKRMTKALRW